MDLLRNRPTFEEIYFHNRKKHTKITIIAKFSRKIMSRTEIKAACQIYLAIFPVLYNISQQNLAILLNSIWSFRKFCFCCLNQKLVYYAKNPMIIRTTAVIAKILT